MHSGIVLHAFDLHDSLEWQFPLLSSFYRWRKVKTELLSSRIQTQNKAESRAHILITVLFLGGRGGSGGEWV